MKLFLLILALFPLLSHAVTSKDINQKYIEHADSFFNPKFDYTKFTGRVTDKDDTGNILKVRSDNLNAKFFRSGDLVMFGLKKDRDYRCEAYVRSIEKDYFIIYVSDLKACWNGKYFRRGTSLNFYSKQLATRVRDASQFRLLLLKRREDFYQQLKDINNFIGTYSQKGVELAAEYDKKILALEQEKQRALSALRDRKTNSYKIRRELVKRLDKLDLDLDFYRVELYDKKGNRWSKDHHLGIPFSKRPPKPKTR